MTPKIQKNSFFLQKYWPLFPGFNQLGYTKLDAQEQESIFWICSIRSGIHNFFSPGLLIIKQGDHM